MCEYFLREETSKLVGGFLSQKNFRKGEYFCEYPKFGEDVWREHFKNLFIKKRVNRSISKLKKARKKNLWVSQILRSITRGIKIFDFCITYYVDS